MNNTIKKIQHQAQEGMVWFQKQWVSAKKLATDGCSGVPELGLTRYCHQHDADYTTGSGVSRLNADIKLFRSIWYKASKSISPGKKAFYYVLAPVFFIGVRVMGRQYYQTGKK